MFGGFQGKNAARHLAMAQVGLEMVAPIVVGLAVDYSFGWTPVGVIVGAVLGLVGGLYHLVYLASQKDDPPPGASGGTSATSPPPGGLGSQGNATSGTEPR